MRMLRENHVTDNAVELGYNSTKKTGWFVSLQTGVVLIEEYGNYEGK